MIDEIFDRNYQAGRAALNADIGKAADRIARTIGNSLKVLHRIEWSAPWARPARPPQSR